MVGPAKRKNLAQELAELSNPAPLFKDHDPEDFDGFGVGSFRKREQENADSDGNEDHIKRNEGAFANRLRFRGDIELEGSEYSGKKSNRLEILGESVGVQGGQGAAEEEDEDDEGDADEEDEDGSMGIGGEAGGMGGGENEEMEALDKEYAELQQHEMEVWKSVKPKVEEDRKKGAAIMQQRALWDQMLEIRISLQKPLQGGCRLPQPPARNIFVTSDEKLKYEYGRLSSSCFQAMSTLLELQNELMQRNAAIRTAYESQINANGKRAREGDEEEAADWSKMEAHAAPTSLDAIWQRVEDLHARLSPYTQSSIDRWQRKTLLSSGAASSRGKLKALSQNVSAQVMAAMANSTKLLQRTKLKKGSAGQLGEKLESAPNLSEKEEPASDKLPDEGEKVADDLDYETYDDSDFYQQILREFLETTDPGALEGSTMRSLRKLRNNKKKFVDHRASKDRKIRYLVIPQLINFMTSAPKDIPPVAIKLFNNLFGQRPVEA